MRFPNTISEIDISISSDCQSTLDNLWNTSLMVTWAKHLHQIIREIKIIQS